MNGFIRKALAVACFAGAIAPAGCVHRCGSVNGCDGAGGGVGGGKAGSAQSCLFNYWDPCWPQRYNAEARQEVVAAFTPQVLNGHILDQTLWNWYFEPGTDRLNPAGMEKLDNMVRRRPSPDARLFIQTARDIPYTVDDPDKFADGRRDLDTRRVVAIQKYLGAQTAGRPMQFEVLVHDPVEVGLAGDPAVLSLRRQRFMYTGTLQGARGGVGGAGGGVGGMGGGMGGMGGGMGGGIAPGSGLIPGNQPGIVPGGFGPGGGYTPAVPSGGGAPGTVNPGL